MTQGIYSFCCNVILKIPSRGSFQSNSRGLVSFDNTSMFRLDFPDTAVGFTTSVYCFFLQGLAAGIGIYNFLRAFFSRRPWSPHPQVQWRRYHVFFWRYRVLVFSITHFCFAFRFAASDIRFRHIWPYIVGSWGRLFSRASHSRTMKIRQVAFSFK